MEEVWAGAEREEEEVMVAAKAAAAVVEQMAAQVGEGHKGQSRQQRAGCARYKRHPQCM